MDLSYYKNRWYDAETGRFLSHDPLGIVPEGYDNSFDVLGQYYDNENLYHYLRSCPVVFYDTYGLKRVCGLDVWMYTGSWCSSQEVYDAAALALLGKAEEQVKCLAQCEISAHVAIAKTVVGVGVAHGTYETLPIPKAIPKMLGLPRGTGISNWTNLPRTYASALKNNKFCCSTEKIKAAQNMLKLLKMIFINMEGGV